MGAGKSKEPKPKYCNHSPLPEDSVQYGGAKYTFLICQVQVQLSSTMNFGFSSGRPLVTSNIDSYYPMLSQYCQQGYTLNTFYRVPLVAHASGFGSVVMPYEAMFSKPTDGSFQDGSVQYDLKIEKSMMHVQAMHTGMIMDTGGVVANTSDIIQKIAQHSSHGGRLICVELTGYAQSQGFSNAMQGMSGGMGVDVLFSIPRHPNATLYSYQCVNVPIGFRVHPGFNSSMSVECDFMGQYAAYLNQGWKLVEIFLDQGMQSHGAFSMSGQMGSVWFFEKETAKVQDPTPVYEGTIITYEHIIKSGFGGVNVKSDWSPVLQQMGERGWELACLLETPQQRRTGFTTASVTILLFFQRRIIGRG